MKYILLPLPTVQNSNVRSCLGIISYLRIYVPMHYNAVVLLFTVQLSELTPYREVCMCVLMVTVNRHYEVCLRYKLEVLCLRYTVVQFSAKSKLI